MTPSMTFYWGNSMFLIILSMIITSCGVADADYVRVRDYRTGPQVVSNPVKAYVSEFEETFNVSVTYSVTITDDLDMSTNGVCFYMQTGNNVRPVEVKLNRVQWDKGNYSSRKKLIWHELGHCSLKLEHSSDMYSIMYFAMNMRNIVEDYEFTNFIELYGDYE